MDKGCLYVELKVSTFTFQIQHKTPVGLEITFSGRGTGTVKFVEDHWMCMFDDKDWVKRFVSDDYGWDWVDEEFNFVRPMLPQIEAYLLSVKQYNGSVDQRVRVLMSKRGR